jgi:hypothetical protein
MRFLVPVMDDEVPDIGNPREGVGKDDDFVPQVQ